MMTEGDARTAIIKWARAYFSENEEQVTPTVEVLNITYDGQTDEWEAELSVSTSADNPFVTFFEMKQRRSGIEVTGVEY